MSSLSTIQQQHSRFQSKILCSSNRYKLYLNEFEKDNILNELELNDLEIKEVDEKKLESLQNNIDLNLQSSNYHLISKYDKYVELSDYSKWLLSLKEIDKKKIIDWDQAAAQSIEENEHIISESYAKLLIKQGYKSKAKKMIEQLIIKYPEKNIYFAELLKDTEE